MPDLDYSQLGPVLNSIMGSQDREFAHASGMQSKDLSARSSMNKASLANALKIASMQDATSRYGIDTTATTQRYGIDQDTLRARYTNAMNYLSMAAQLQGPSNYFQQSNFYRGAAGSDFPAFLQDLMSDQGIGGMVSGASNLQGFGAQSGQATPASMQTLIQGLTSGTPANQPSGTPGAAGSSGAPGTPGQGLLGSINQIAQNFHRLAPGSLESLTPDELGLLQSGVQASGHSMPALLDIYAKSRPSQGAARAA